MKAEEILNEFVEECKNSLELDGIIQFGSSTYTDEYDDIDLLLFSSEDIVTARDHLRILEIFKEFEDRHSEVVFDFSGANRKRKAEIEITALIYGREDLSSETNPHEIFFYKTLAEDKNKKVLYGKDPTDGRDFNLTKRQIYDMLYVDTSSWLRSCMDDVEYRNNAIYKLFKSTIRKMLIKDPSMKKAELLSAFKKEFEGDINLPKNSEEIVRNNLVEDDLKDVLLFIEECERYLLK